MTKVTIELKAVEIPISEIPEVSGVDVAFGGIGDYQELMAKIWPVAEEEECVGDRRGYAYRDMTAWQNSKWGDMVSAMFFGGTAEGEMEKWPMKELTQEDGARVWGYYRAVLGSFAPQHEEKTGLCAWLLSLLLERPVEVIGNKK